MTKLESMSIVTLIFVNRLSSPCHQEEHESVFMPRRLRRTVKSKTGDLGRRMLLSQVFRVRTACLTQMTHLTHMTQMTQLTQMTHMTHMTQMTQMTHMTHVRASRRELLLLR